MEECLLEREWLLIVSTGLQVIDESDEVGGDAEEYDELDFYNAEAQFGIDGEDPDAEAALEEAAMSGYSM